MSTKTKSVPTISEIQTQFDTWLATQNQASQAVQNFAERYNRDYRYQNEHIHDSDYGTDKSRFDQNVQFSPPNFRAVVDRMPRSFPTQSMRVYLALYNYRSTIGHLYGLGYSDKPDKAQIQEVKERFEQAKTDWDAIASKTVADWTAVFNGELEVPRQLLSVIGDMESGLINETLKSPDYMRQRLEAELLGNPLSATVPTTIKSQLDTLKAIRLGLADWVRDAESALAQWIQAQSKLEAESLAIAHVESMKSTIAGLLPEVNLKIAELNQQYEALLSELATQLAPKDFGYGVIAEIPLYQPDARLSLLQLVEADSTTTSALGPARDKIYLGAAR